MVITQIDAKMLKIKILQKFPFKIILFLYDILNILDIHNLFNICIFETECLKYLFNLYLKLSYIILLVCNDLRQIKSIRYQTLPTDTSTDSSTTNAASNNSAFNHNTSTSTTTTPIESINTPSSHPDTQFSITPTPSSATTTFHTASSSSPFSGFDLINGPIEVMFNEDYKMEAIMTDGVVNGLVRITR